MQNAKLLFVIVIYAFSTNACASSPPKARLDYILSHPHGWIEFTITDDSIPKVPLKDKNSDRIMIKPYNCTISVWINNEFFFSHSVYPTGDDEPYSVKSGFRIPVPLTSNFVRMKYKGCDIDEDGETTLIETITKIKMIENMVVEIIFNGLSLQSKSPTKNEVITLKDLRDAILNLKKE